MIKKEIINNGYKVTICSNINYCTKAIYYTVQLFKLNENEWESIEGHLCAYLDFTCTLTKRVINNNTSWLEKLFNKNKKEEVMYTLRTFGDIGDVLHCKYLESGKEMIVEYIERFKQSKSYGIVKALDLETLYDIQIDTVLDFIDKQIALEK